MKIFISFNSNTEHDGSCLAEIMPKVGVFGFSNKVLENVLIRSSRVLRSRSGLSELGNELKLFGNTVSEFTVRLLNASLFFHYWSVV